MIFFCIHLVCERGSQLSFLNSVAAPERNWTTPPPSGAAAGSLGFHPRRSITSEPTRADQQPYGPEWSRRVSSLQATEGRPTV